MGWYEEKRFRLVDTTRKIIVSNECYSIQDIFNHPLSKNSKLEFRLENEVIGYSDISNNAAS